ncbi:MULTISPECIES: hypothetical protein [Legionella]|uniref:Uncharacterized protein n=1 Tax=Legionella maceachernii TaxID=466 RepID=A0A0W0VXN0_9GAMM|nr:hypothetical protein [Legionella maceachernii]KTD24901.1 hypothetical protein Lmac_2438 [Legionella maceachernii]SKA16133.1 hypothetical protein SAMN02745128_02346 [Legionella maceachernii]SUP01608.1 Uncharacterised protein [Legionella maceachernii]
MALLKEQHKQKKVKLNLEIDQKLFFMIKEYCKWASIDDIDYFIEQIALFVFKKDKEWKKFKSKTLNHDSDK